MNKLKRHELLSRDFNVIASIGDSFEEEQAAAASGIPFVHVDPCKPADGWAILDGRITELGCIKSGETE